VPHTSIFTADAPKPIGTYSQALRANNMVFLAAQAPIHPQTMEVVRDDIAGQIRQVLENLSAVAKASGGSLADAVKVTVYLTDLANFPLVNEAMKSYFKEPYPARASVGVKELPRQTAVAIEAILVLPDGV